jgi:hypothetical protein
LVAEAQEDTQTTQSGNLEGHTDLAVVVPCVIVEPGWVEQVLLEL